MQDCLFVCVYYLYMYDSGGLEKFTINLDAVHTYSRFPLIQSPFFKLVQLAQFDKTTDA